MPYAITAYFDAESETRIRDIWKLLSEHGVCDYLWKSENKPHIKLFMMDGLDVVDAEMKMEQICRTTNPFSIHFKNYGVYPNSNPIVFLDIAANKEILALQKAVYTMFSPYPHQVAGNYFEENIYKPDCFLTISIEKEKAVKGLEVLLNEPLPFEGKVDSVGLISFHPAKRLLEYRLQAML